jgi:hypothetical protein
MGKDLEKIDNQFKCYNRQRAMEEAAGEKEMDHLKRFVLVVVLVNAVAMCMCCSVQAIGGVR